MSRLLITVGLLAAASSTVYAQAKAPRKQLLVIGEEKGYRQEAVWHAMARPIRTHTEALTNGRGNE